MATSEPATDAAAAAMPETSLLSVATALSIADACAHASTNADAVVADTKPEKRVFEFNMAHELKYGLEVVARDAITDRVTSVVCRFCQHFGREEKHGRKRRVTKNLKYFKPSFRTDQYMQHLLLQHPVQWAAYSSASQDEKLAFFPAANAATSDQPLSAATNNSSTVTNNDVSAACNVDSQRKRVGRPPKSDSDRANAKKKPRLAPAPTAAAVSDSLPAAPAPIAAAVKAVAPAVTAPSSAAASPSSIVAADSAAADVDDAAHWFELRRSVVDYVVTNDRNSSSGSSTGARTAARTADADDKQLWCPQSFRCCEFVPARSAGDDDASSPTTSTTDASRSTITSSSSSSKRDDAVYLVAVRSRVQLDLAVDLFATGQTRRQVAQTLSAVVARTGLDPVLAAAESDVAELAQLSAAASLDAVAQLLAQSWAFAIDVHTAAHAAYVAIRVRVAEPSTAAVRSVHVVTLPLTCDAPLFERVAQAMDAVLPAWRRRVIGVGSDSATARCDRIVELIARIEREATHTVHRSWSYSSELDAAMQQFYSALLGGAFVASFTALMTYIQGDAGLVREMGPRPSAHAWLAMGHDTAWVTDKRVRLRKHLEDETAAAAAPDDAWWVAFFVVDWVAGRANDAFNRLQSRRLLASQQTDVFADLASDLVQAFNVQGPLSVETTETGKTGETAETVNTVETTAASDSTTQSQSRRFAVSSASVGDFLADLGVFVNNIVARVEPAALDAVVASVAVGIATLVETLTDLAPATASRTRKNSSSTEEPDTAATATAVEALPPVLPHEFAALGGREFAALLERYSEPLRASFSDEEMDRMDQEHQALRRASSKDKSLQAVLLACDDETSFEQAWLPTLGRFPALQRFAGGLATVFAATADDSDATATADATATVVDAASGSTQRVAALERVLHAQQFHTLQRLVRPPDAVAV